MAEEQTDKQKRDAAKRASIKKAAHKTATHAHYVVGPQGAYMEGVLYKEGDLIKLPIDKEPSRTFRPASAKGVAFAEAKAAAEDADTGDELVAAEVEGDEAEAEAPAAKPSKKAPAAKPAKAGRTANRDI